MVAAVAPFPGGGRLAFVAVEPIFHNVVIELFRPEQAGESLPHHLLGIGRQVRRNHRSVELVRFALPVCKDRVEVAGQQRFCRHRQVR